MNEAIMCKIENCHNKALIDLWCWRCLCKIGDGQSTYLPPRGVKE